MRISLFVLIGVLIVACARDSREPASNMAAAREAKKERAELRDAIRKIEPFFKPMGKPGPSDWLTSFPETGQTFDEYLDAKPVKPTRDRQKIYVLPLGTFNAKQKSLIAVTAAYLEAFYDLPVEQMPPQTIKRPLSQKNSRRNPYSHVERVRTGYLLDEVLKPILQMDAAALIAFTIDDLYPDESMAYVFGQASLENRVGVWSLARLDDNTDERGFLLRTLKIAVHETGHMFSMRHCTKYECVMSGTNHLNETDSRPIDACPECMAKICWLSDAEPALRYQRLAAFCRQNGLTREADDFTRKAEAVRKV